MGIWTNEEGRCLFTILNEYRPNRSIDWKRIETIFNSQSRDPRTVIQLKNHVHSRIDKWKAWGAMNKMPGIEFTEEGLPPAAELETERFLAFFEIYGPYGRYVARNKMPNMDIWGPFFSDRFARAD